jgi:hypothetical protein
VPPEVAASSRSWLVRLRATLAGLRDQEGEPYLLAVVRIGFGLLLLNEAWLATQQLRGAGFFGDYFHQPMLPEWLVVSEGPYEALIAAQWAAAVAIISGRGARPALLLASGLLLYAMLCDRLWFHHYRHTMAAFSALLAFAPCDRDLVLGRGEPGARPAPLWAANALKAQVSLMYLSSGGSKLFDPDWRGGQMMRGMVLSFARLLRSRGVPADWITALQTPLGAGLMARGAIATEISLALLLWWPETRRLALWVGLLFHLSISLMTPVQLFTAEMLCVYLLFVTPDRMARTIRFDPDRHYAVGAIESLDWLRRFRIEPSAGAELVVIDRGGARLEGVEAAACVFGTIPLLFLGWPVVALAARLARATGGRAPG